MEVIEARANGLGAPIIAHGQHWQVWKERGRLVFQDETGLLDLPKPALPGPHQIENAGISLAALRYIGKGDAEAAMTQVVWPARLQRLRRGPLVKAAGLSELWLDGGHNPAAGEALALALLEMPRRPVHLICGMLNTKDVAGYLRPLAAQAKSLTAVEIPGEANTLSAEETATAARSAGIETRVANSVDAAVASLPQDVRILICGSLYLAGRVLRENE
jgi:dihydrofolate synthase/folylpolyglutamate synthase